MLKIGLIVPILLFIAKSKWDKYLFSPLITLSCLVLSAFSGAHACIFACLAFLFSVFGDFFLSHKSIHKDSYLFGIAGFFLAHAGFLAYALANSGVGILSPIIALVLVIPYGIYLVKRLYPALDNMPMRIAVTLYMLISISVFACAFSMNLPVYNKILFIVGIFMILFSDTIISISDFLGQRKWDKLILPTYYLCHILVCASMIL